MLSLGELKLNCAFILSCRCDADPAALANYVVALVKKDKPEKELKALCADQLDVFLQKGKNVTLSSYFVVITTMIITIPCQEGLCKRFSAARKGKVFILHSLGLIRNGLFTWTVLKVSRDYVIN